MRTTADPRDIITPAAFTVAPDLLGHPLARPWRRAMAILIDLLLCAILVGLLEVPSIFFSTVAAVLLYRLTRRRDARPTLWRRAFNGMLRLSLAVVVFGLLVAASQSIGGLFSRESEAPEPAGPGMVQMPLMDAGITVAEGLALFRATTPEAADRAAERIVERLTDHGLDEAEIHELREALDEVERENSGVNPLAIAALRRALGRLVPAAEEDAPPDPDSLALAYGAALAAGDSGTAASLRPTLVAALAGGQVGELERRNRRLTRRVDQLEEEIGRLEDDGDGVSITRWLRSAADDLGLGFGWLMLYFTAFTAMWRGHTPGKRLLGIRVIRLDGQPIGWWLAFERFGGYSAALATGLLGFAQILWDRNRQAIHDKIASTVVVQERGATRLPQQAGGGA